MAALTAAALVTGSPGAWAADVSGTLVQAVEVFKWSTPSSDPSGIAVRSDGNLTISDGEVEETTFYKNANVFHASRTGALQSTSDTTRFSDEPTGVAYGPNGLVFVSDDDADVVFVADGFSDPSPIRISTTPFMTDPEGVAYDTFRKEILIANGEGGAGFVRYSPGADGRFGTSDDRAGTKITVAGAIDTEGVAYDGVRDTVLLLDSGSSEKIYEMTANGAVINTISLAGISGMRAPAGVEVAAASSGSGRNYYIVDRGADPGTTSSANDGMLYEVRASGLSDAGPGVDQPPTANAGPDKVITLADTLTLTGSGTDPEGGAVTYAWSKFAGPGTVTFGSAGAATTTGTFSAAGQYTVRLTVTDAAGGTDFDDVEVTVTEAGGEATIERRVIASSDDAREGDVTATTFVKTDGKTLDLGQATTTAGTFSTKVGIRFANIPVPKGGEIISARIQFMADTVPSSGTAAFNIVGEAADNAVTYSTTAPAKVSTRTYGQTSVSWSPADWGVANERGAAQRTGELKAILQEIVNRPGWAQGNAAAFKIEGTTGTRIARSYDAVTATGATVNAAPALLLQFTVNPTAPANTAPVVSAGADSEVRLPAKATLDGTVTDDGKPAPPATVTTAWSKVSGPGTVTFGDAALVDTTAQFSAAGTYTLRLTANDSALTGQDEVTITVKPADTTPPPPPPGSGGNTPPPANTAPVVKAGADMSVTLPGAATLDGTVTDDGRPSGSVAVTWSKVSGPGDVTFADSKKVDTTASFTQAGRYTLRLTASDSALTGQDEVTITVEAPSEPEPVVTELTGAVTHRSILVGTRTTIRGLVSPTAAEHLLRLQRWNGEKWRTVQTRRLAEASEASYRFRVLAQASGVSRYRVVSPAQAGLARAVVGGKALTVKAYRAAIERVNPRADVVVVKNTGKVAFSTAGWWLVERRSGARVGLPDFTVRPGRVVRIHTGEGATGGRHLYLDSGEMWAPHGVAELRDARVRLADRLKY